MLYRTATLSACALLAGAMACAPGARAQEAFFPHGEVDDIVASALPIAAPSCALALAPGPAGDGWVPVRSAELDAMRGGFTSAAGLEVSLGIERLVSINGSVVARTSFQIADMARVSAEEARLSREALSSVNLVQNGSGNIYLAHISPEAMGGTVIQNTLNDQLISSQTVISSTANSMGLLKTLNFQGSLSAAIANAVGPR